MHRPAGSFWPVVRCLDLVLTPDGRYVFLEVNPSGQYGWIQDLVGLPIDEAVADLLLAGGRTRSEVASAVGFLSARDE